MKAVVGIIALVLFLQIIFDAMMFTAIVHGEVAWRWQMDQQAAFRNVPSYPGYYCGSHNCALAPGMVQP